MGKKLKVGKQRKDKFYHLAKEAGYRSRAAFKLIQLNKRFEFLQKSRALVDLCAAPGGWLQVAAQNMPVSSMRIGIDVVPIKPINSCITLQGDITTERARQMIKRELQTWEADCVLHDGAPNVGLNWLHDAFQQNCLTLSALRLATQVLTKNGCFVTKVFRSNDYHSLIAVFEKLFKKIHVWKPAASRLESAEIFVVCEKYLKPAKVDAELLDPRKVFSESKCETKPANPQLMLLTRRKEKKVKAEGYEGTELTLYKVIPASQFIQSRDYLDLLSKTNKIVLDDERWEKNPATTEEVRHCIEDVKVCGPRELRHILLWRKKLLKSIEEEVEPGEEMLDKEQMEVNETPDPDAVEDEELARIDEEIARAKAEDKAKLKKKKKKMLKEKAKAQMRKQLKMVHEGDVQIATEQDLFSLKSVAKAKQLAAVMNDSATVDAPPDDSELSEDEKMDEGEWETIEGVAESDDDEESGLIQTEESGMTKEEKKKSRADKWFARDGLAEVLNDEEEALLTVEKHLRKRNDKAKLYENTVAFDEKDIDEKNDDMMEQDSKFVEEESTSEEEFVEEDKRVAKRGPQEEKPKKESKKRRLAPELLALGEQLIYSSKTRRDLEDWAWNRYTNNDVGLPDWFVEDEKKHYRKELPVTKEQVLRYKERMRELNVRPIKKVIEAKARKRRRVAMKLQRAKKKAEGIVENESMEHAEKLREMKKIYRKAALKEKKEVTYQVMTKGKRGKLSRPSGLYKVVDARQKKDHRREKAESRAVRWKKMSSAARRAQLEKSRKRRSAQRSERIVSRRQRRGKPQFCLMCQQMMWFSN
uniref:Putative rRNA methyltransferase n=1 Tax=Parascaris univalens TaxID=6257 RepID=A0A915BJE3_PARUN